MVRLLGTAALAVAATFATMPQAQAVRYCYNNGGGCVYDSGGYWCWWEQGSNGNWREVCVGATGYRICTYSFPDPDPVCGGLP